MSDRAEDLRLQADYGASYFLSWLPPAPPKSDSNGKPPTEEQAIDGRIVVNLEAVREAVDAFVKRYNAHWRLEKRGFHTPLEARQAALRQEAA